MEPRAKIMSLDSQTTAFDPLLDFDPRLPHIQEKIFSYLNGNDVKNCFLVSKDWNMVTSKSPTAMSKIKFKINEKSEFLDEVLQTLNFRRYQSMSIKVNSKAHCELAFELILRNSEALVNLEINFNIGSSPDCNFQANDAKLSKLKRLNVWNVPTDLLQNFLLGTSDNLEELDLHRMNKEGLDLSKVAGKSKLKTLHIYFVLLADPAFLNAKFKLSCLTLYSFLSIPQPNENVKSFIKMMAPTLTNLNMNLYPATFDLLWILPNLVKLSVYDIFNLTPAFFKDHSVELPSIREFKISRLTYEQLKIFITQSLINVEILSCKTTGNNDEIEWIARNMKGLKKLVIYDSSAQDVQDVKDRYQEMTGEFNRNIEIVSI